MAFVQYLNFDGMDLPLPDSYEIESYDVEADSGGETEAGTIQRDVVRSGVLTIAVSFSVSVKRLQILSQFRRHSKIQVVYFDTEKCGPGSAEIYIEGFKAKLEKDTSYKGLWSVSFVLKEM